MYMLTCAVFEKEHIALKIMHFACSISIAMIVFTHAIVCSVHSFLEQEGEEDATWMDLRRKHEPQVVVKKSNSVENTTSPCSPPKPLSLHDVLHAKPGVYHKEHLVRITI